ncbi:Retrovirus-related Pol polyprotein from transposon TNT 1-94 [Senna tora]|uniref:Retrovirus-related Pol polyprotein from transposon TNT 1-94 n=1 Tax=Senna tora TaxID=362788 RepID=A0A834T0Z6_9FABA|nr:Retrovirus-related Pol polyprotein from transposon TNT 1-94 [Senna tora]
MVSEQQDPVVMAAKFEIEKFNDNNDFSLWRVKMRALLVQQGLLKALEGKEALSTELSNQEKDDLLERALSTILLSLADDVLREVADEKSAAGLWLKLGTLYMTKSLTNQLYLKQRLYTLRMKEGTPIKEHLAELNKVIMDLKNTDALTMEDVKASLNSRELKRRVSENWSENQAEGLFGRAGFGAGKDGGKLLSPVLLAENTVERNDPLPSRASKSTAVVGGRPVVVGGDVGSASSSSLYVMDEVTTETIGEIIVCMVTLMVALHNCLMRETLRIGLHRNHLPSRSYTLNFHKKRAHLRNLVYSNDSNYYNVLRMYRATFDRLCSMIDEIGGLKPTKHMLVDEQVAMCLNVLAHHTKNRVIQ